VPGKDVAQSTLRDSFRTLPTYLGLNLDAPCSAEGFRYGDDVDVGRRRARRVGHGCLVLVLLGLVEVCLAVGEGVRGGAGGGLDQGFTLLIGPPTGHGNCL